jgi:hypothetical protein
MLNRSSKIQIVAIASIVALLAIGIYRLTSASSTWPRSTPSPSRAPAVRSTTFQVRFRPISIAVDSQHNIYVGSDSPSSVSVYRSDEFGDVALDRVIVGPHTSIDDPESIAIDDSGNLFVASFLNSKILRFSRGTSGDVRPVSVLEGSRTKLDHPNGIALDRRGGVNVLQGTGNASVVVFAEGAEGNTAPMKVIAGPLTLLSYSMTIQIDRDGTIFVGNYGLRHTESAAYHGEEYITTFAPSATGNVSPLTVGGFRLSSRHFAIDNDNTIYVFGIDDLDVYRARDKWRPSMTIPESDFGGFSPDNCAVRDGQLYITDLQHSRVGIIRPRNP